jgi:hypothetical protein
METPHRLKSLFRVVVASFNPEPAAMLLSEPTGNLAVESGLNDLSEAE